MDAARAKHKAAERDDTWLFPKNGENEELSAGGIAEGDTGECCGTLLYETTTRKAKHGGTHHAAATTAADASL